MKLKSKEQASYNPAVDREKLHIWLDLVYDDFAGRLLEKYQLTGRERDVCYLKALDFSDDEISELLLSGKLKGKSTIHVDVGEKNNLVFNAD